MSKKKQKSLAELQKIWYKKLEDSGFEDCEDTSSPDCPLKAYHSYDFRRSRNIKNYEAQKQYYQDATYFLNDALFDTGQHKTIWEMHSNGVSAETIAQKLKLTYHIVRRVIEKYRNRMYGRV